MDKQEWAVLERLERYCGTCKTYDLKRHAFNTICRYRDDKSFSEGFRKLMNDFYSECITCGIGNRPKEEYLVKRVGKLRPET